jgi:predicted nucleotidyltransferase
MTSSSINLSGKIPDDVLTNLKNVCGAAESMSLPIFVVGATARDIILEYIHGIRPPLATADVDFGVVVETWEEFEHLRKKLLEDAIFEEVNKTFKFRHKTTRIPIDLIPFGGLEAPSGSLRFAKDGLELTTAGFGEAFASSIEVHTGDGFEFKVASIPGLVLLKLIAFYDRPLERMRDIQDIWLILKKFLDIGNEDRLYNEHIDLLDEPDFDLDLAAARLLGRDVAVLLTTKTRPIVMQTLSENDPVKGLNRMIGIVDRSENRPDDISDRVKKVLLAFRHGLTEAG